ncbi:hypothetical protein BST81_19895 [Leptolyngbya sp. 'hensonii']|uniref:hypothetical protein n=1 Tax=Leptolyngbya sp. 'hensonii' TaxID=1922337 RepID=UPI0009693FB0|nr:hypothetical protein [Leptolyngbya sp. 'hensonii']OLP16703.1 hypothetical protein BST81_19895 [Leptolyngbya sp. 'hensonii']
MTWKPTIVRNPLMVPPDRSVRATIAQMGRLDRLTPYQSSPPCQVPFEKIAATLPGIIYTVIQHTNGTTEDISGSMEFTYTSPIVTEILVCQENPGNTWGKFSISSLYH